MSAHGQLPLRVYENNMGCLLPSIGLLGMSILMVIIAFLDADHGLLTLLPFDMTPRAFAVWVIPIPLIGVVLAWRIESKAAKPEVLRILNHGLMYDGGASISEDTPVIPWDALTVASNKITIRGEGVSADAYLELEVSEDNGNRRIASLRLEGLSYQGAYLAAVIKSMCEHGTLPTSSI